MPFHVSLMKHFALLEEEESVVRIWSKEWEEKCIFFMNSLAKICHQFAPLCPSPFLFSLAVHGAHPARAVHAHASTYCTIKLYNSSKRCMIDLVLKPQSCFVLDKWVQILIMVLLPPFIIGLLTLWVQFKRSFLGLFRPWILLYIANSLRRKSETSRNVFWFVSCKKKFSQVSIMYVHTHVFSYALL